MKKTKPVLALLAALALLLAAACQQELSPTSPDLGDYYDARTNQKYDANNVKGSEYFPSFSAVTSLNGGRSDSKLKESLIKIYFGGSNGAIDKVNNAGLILDILKGSETEVRKNIEAAIFFEGVKYVPTASIGTAGVHNNHTPLSYTIVTVERDTVYVQLADLLGYEAVQPYIKASAYTISGKPIDTDGNLKGGEPYDDYYDSLISIANSVEVPGTSILRSRSPIAFELFDIHNESTDANYYYASEFADFPNVPDETFAGLGDYIKLEKWNVSAKKWDSPIAGAYATSGDFEGTYYFNISVSPTGYDKYRVVAKDLYKFETSTAIKGFKRRFAYYPGKTSLDGDEWKVTVKDGTKVLTDSILPAMGKEYAKIHLTEITSNNQVFSSMTVQTDGNGKNAMLIVTVNTDTGTKVGNLGLAALPEPVAEFNKNFKLAYLASGTSRDDPLAVFDYIGITKHALREKPGSKKNETTGQIFQELVLTLDPNHTWENGKAIYIYARDGIKYAGDDTSKPTPPPHISGGSLGDANGTINIDGNWDWGYYGNFTANAASAPTIPNFTTSTPGYTTNYTGNLNDGYNTFYAAELFSTRIDVTPMSGSAFTLISNVDIGNSTTLFSKESFEPIGTWAYIYSNDNKIGIVFEVGSEHILILGRSTIDNSIDQLSSNFVGFSSITTSDISDQYNGILNVSVKFPHPLLNAQRTGRSAAKAIWEGSRARGGSSRRRGSVRLPSEILL